MFGLMSKKNETKEKSTLMCPKCGKPAKEYYNFCPKCRTKLKLRPLIADYRKPVQ